MGVTHFLGYNPSSPFSLVPCLCPGVVLSGGCAEQHSDEARLTSLPAHTCPGCPQGLSAHSMLPLLLILSGEHSVASLAVQGSAAFGHIFLPFSCHWPCPCPCPSGFCRCIWALCSGHWWGVAGSAGITGHLQGPWPTALWKEGSGPSVEARKGQQRQPSVQGRCQCPALATPESVLLLAV